MFRRPRQVTLWWRAAGSPVRRRTTRCLPSLLQECRLWWQNQTLLCVTHDLSETLAFDRVLVVEKGRIVEDAIPSELAQQHSHYQALLAAEETLREQLWQDDAWRRLTLQDGHLHDVPAATNQKHVHGH